MIHFSYCLDAAGNREGTRPMTEQAPETVELPPLTAD